MGWELLKWFFAIITIGAGLFLFIRLAVKFLRHKGLLKLTKWKNKETDYVNEDEVIDQMKAEEEKAEEPEVTDEEKPKVE